MKIKTGINFFSGLILILLVLAFCLGIPFSEPAARGSKNFWPQFKVPQSDKTALDWRYGGTLYWGTTNPPSDINPVITHHGVSAALIPLVFNPLFKANGQGELVADLVQKWEVSKDGLEYTFYLREGVFFHDGVEFGAEDVKFTFDAIADDQNHSPIKELTRIDGAWAIVDKHTIKLVLTEKDENLFHKLTRYVLPMHAFESTDVRTAAVNSHPVGTGPFRFHSFNREAARLELVANTDYFEGRPYLDRIIVNTYPDNTALWAALMRQEVDFVKYLNQRDFDVLSADHSFKTYQVPGKITCAIIYNCKDPLLSDVRVRQAIAMSIDVEKILNGIGMKGHPSTGPFQSSAPGFNSAVRPFQYAPDKGLLLFNEAGWYTDSDGILKKDGNPFLIKMLVDARSEYYERMAMLIRQQLSEVGVKVIVLRYQDESELTPGFLRQNSPQAWLRMVTSSAYSAQALLERWYPSASSLSRLWNYENSQLDALLEKAKGRSGVDNQEIYRHVHELIYQDQPACFLFSPVTLHAVSSAVKNEQEFFSPSMPGHTIKDWYMTAPIKRAETAKGGGEK